MQRPWLAKSHPVIKMIKVSDASLSRLSEHGKSLVRLHRPGEGRAERSSNGPSLTVAGQAGMAEAMQPTGWAKAVAEAALQPTRAGSEASAK
jgi:hypothetical protein